jgi:hypothetical protein
VGQPGIEEYMTIISHYNLCVNARDGLIDFLESAEVFPSKKDFEQLVISLANSKAISLDLASLPDEDNESSDSAGMRDWDPS